MKIEFFSFPKNKGSVARAIRMIDECEGKADGTKFAVVTYFLRDESCSLRTLDDGESIEDVAEREVFWRGGENDGYDRVVISQNTDDDGYIISLYRTDEESDDPWCKVFLVPVEKWAKKENKEVEA